MNRLEQVLSMLEQDPKDIFLRYAECLERVKMGQFDTAAERLRLLTKEESSYLPSYYQLGKVYEQLERWQDAFDTYQKGMLVAEAAGNKKTLSELSLAAEIIEDDYL